MNEWEVTDDNRGYNDTEGRRKGAAKGHATLKSISIAVLVLLLALVFFSKTIYRYNLPQVTATIPKMGKLSKMEITTGTVKFAHEKKLYAELAGTVGEMLVEEGDIVAKGQPILRMDFEDEIAELQRQIDDLYESTGQKKAELAMSAEKLLLDIERTELAIKNTNRLLADWRRESYKADTVQDYDLNQCERDLDAARADLEKKKSLEDVGVITAQELEQAEASVKNLEARYENLKEALAENKRKSQESVTEKEKNRQKQVGDLEHQLTLSTQELKGKALDQEDNRVRLETLESEFSSKLQDFNDQLAKYRNNETITADADYTVSALSVNEGLYIQAHQQLVTLNPVHDFIVTCSIAVNNNFVIPGDTCQLENTSHSIDGTVTAVTPGERDKTITIKLDDTSVTAGETFTILFEKDSDQVYTLVPNGAVNQDSDGYYLYQIKRRNGMLGKEFYAEKLRIYIGDSDADSTVVLSGIWFFEPIVLSANSAFDERQTLTLVNEGDFFEEK